MSSRNTASNNSKNTTVTTPYCKVCYDAGKLKSEYTSHFVKDQPGPEGKVICPTLLNQACRICNKTGHTSSYCPNYNSRRREEPRREERYIPREEPRREERYIPREEQPRREERYIPREEPRRDDRDDERRRREERYIPREEPRRDDRRREERYIPREEPRRASSGSCYESLREDTERREQDIRQRDEEYNRQQDRRSKPWLQAALKNPEQQQQRREPYAHPHGPRTRLTLEANALCTSKHAVAEPEHPAAAIDVQKVNLNHASKWGDEDAEEPFVYNPEEMSREFFQNAITSSFTTSAEHDFIAACDNQNEMPFFCGQ